MSLLLRTPQPHPTESLLGYVLRISEENGYDSPWHVLVQAGIHQGEMASPGFPHHKLSSLTGRPHTAYEAIAYRDSGKTIGYQLLGHHLGDSSACRPLRLRRPAFCPCCADEVGFIDAFWDLEIAIACSRHRTGLTKACPACGLGLSWFRPGLLQCQCGADLREAVRPGASDAVVALMEVLRAKLHGEVPSLSAPGSLPSGALTMLSLKELIALVRQLGSFALLAATGSSEGGDEAIVEAAAESLAEWPMRFHQLLRRLGELPSARTDTPSLVARLGVFYSTLLKGRPEHAFLRDEFIRFGAQQWGEGLVDARMLSVGADPRFTSRAALARRTGIDPRTLSKWAEEGKLSIKAVESGSRTRYVADASELPAKSDAPGQIIEERLAARLLGLPVAVLAALKGSHYVAANSPAIKRGYHSADVEVFRLKLLGRAATAGPLAADVPACDAITLDAVMRQMRFGGAGHKAAFLGSYLDGDVEGFHVPGSGQSELVFLRSTVDAYARASRASGASISRTDASKMLACSAAVVAALVAVGHLHANSEPHGRVLKASVDSFLERYVPLPLIAAESQTKAATLLRLSEQSGLTLLRITAGRGGCAAFVLREQALRLRELRPALRGRLRPSPGEALRRYLEDLARSGVRLPRKGSVPNKAEIARACGFDRGLFSKDAEIGRLLQRANHDDGLRFQLSITESPSLRVERYLQRLTASGLPVPRRGGKLNKLQIAQGCGVNRNVLNANPELLQMLDAHIDARPGPAA